MNKLFCLVLLAGIFSSVKAQKTVYDKNAELRIVKKFNAIEVSDAITVYLNQSDEIAIAVSADEEKYNEKIKTEVKDGILNISVEAGFWNNFNWGNRKLKVYISVTDINKIEVGGASQVIISGTVKSDALSIELSGASVLKGNFQVKNLVVSTKGASTAKLSGKAAKTKVNSTGASSVNSYELVSETCAINASGASSIHISVSNELMANASGGSSIYYKGNPVKRNINSTGGSSVKQKSGSGD